MTLNLTTGGDYTPFLKYNAKAGRWFVKNENGDEVEVQNPRFAIDFENIKTGWICFPPASPPQFVWDYNGERQPRPEPIGKAQYKDGFEVMVYGSDPVPHLGGQPLGLRQWTSNANAAKGSVKRAYDLFEKGKAANPKKVPVFRCTGVSIIKGINGDSFEPIFELEQWVERSRISEFETAPEAPPPASPPDDELDDEVPF